MNFVRETIESRKYNLDFIRKALVSLYEDSKRYGEIIPDAIKNAIDVIDSERSVTTQNSDKRELSNTKTKGGFLTDKRYAYRIIQKAIDGICPDWIEKPIEREWHSIRCSFLRDKYIEVFLYCECTIELFNAIYYYSHTFVRGRQDYQRKHIEKILIDIASKEILDLHGGFIAKNYLSK